MNPFVQKMAAAFARIGGKPHEWTWFDLTGGLLDVDQNKLIDFEQYLMQCRPPFPRTIVVYGANRNGIEHDALFTIQGDDPKAGIRISAAIMLTSDSPRMLKGFRYFIRDGKLLTSIGNFNEADEQRYVDIGLQMVGLLYHRLMTTRSPACLPIYERNFVNQRLIERGKAPKYTWKTLVVGAKAVERQDLGGIHASPRYHDRRGHQRRLKDGRIVWVKACKVGDPSKGAVFKDYAVRTLQ